MADLGAIGTEIQDDIYPIVFALSPDNTPVYGKAVSGTGQDEAPVVTLPGAGYSTG